MADVEGDGVGSGNVPKASASALCSVWCTGTKGEWKDFRFVSDGRASEGLRLRITMKRG